MPLPTRAEALLPGAALIVLALGGAACREAPAEPYTPAGPPPAGLAASIVLAPSGRGERLPTGSTVTTIGDSVVATTVLSSSCAVWSARAGVANGELVVTVVDSMPEGGRLCNLIASAANYRIVVPGAPRGIYDVVLRERMYFAQQRARERHLFRQTVGVR